MKLNNKNLKKMNRRKRRKKQKMKIRACLFVLYFPSFHRNSIFIPLMMVCSFSFQSSFKSNKSLLVGNQNASFFFSVFLQNVFLFHLHFSLSILFYFSGSKIFDSETREELFKNIEMKSYLREMNHHLFRDNQQSEVFQKYC